MPTRLHGSRVGRKRETEKDDSTAMVRTKEDVLGVLGGHRRAIKALGVDRLGIFGSFARDDPGPRSDVDILVEFDPVQKTFDNFMGLAFLLEDCLGRRVELVTPEGLSPYLGPRILEEVEYAPLFH